MGKIRSNFHTEVWNIFENPDEIREMALKQDYFNCENISFPGKRSKRIPENTLVYKKIISSLIHDLIQNNIFNFSLHSFYQYTDKNTPCIEHVDNLSIINKNNVISGIIYLNPKLPVGDFGTTINGKKISNEYNKLVYYNPGSLHKPTASFGNDIKDSRLVISFAVSENS